MKEKLKCLLLYGGLSKNEYRYIYKERIQISLGIWKKALIFASVYSLAAFLITFVIKAIEPSRMLFLIQFAAVTALAILLGLVSRKNPKLIMPIIYIGFTVLFLCGAVLGASISSDPFTVTFHILIICLPLLIFGSPIPVIIIETLAVIVFAVLCNIPETGAVRAYDVLNASVFWAISLAVNLILIRIKLREILNSKRFTEMGHTDELTGLQSRNAYEEFLRSPSQTADDPNLIYCTMDLNRVKYANDTYGHEAGDELIKGAADIMVSVFSKYGSIYRIGGDEFRAVISATPAEFEEIAEKFKSACVKWRGKYVKEMSVSLGYAARSAFPYKSISDLISISDARMYASKRRYYESRGIERRSSVRAFRAICETFMLILEVNVTRDSYSVIHSSIDLQAEAVDCFSQRLGDYILAGSVHPDDVISFGDAVSREILQTVYENSDGKSRTFFRRKEGNTYRKTVLETVKVDNYTSNDMLMFVFLRDVDEKS